MTMDDVAKKLGYPLTCGLTQPFGANANGSYKATGMLGHPAEDVVCGYGTDVAFPFDAYIYKVLYPNAQHDFTGVFGIVDNGIECFEFLIGHLSEISVAEGAMVKKGQIIGKEGNDGTVYYGDTFITPQMKQAGDRRGTHRHYQKRPVEKLTNGSQVAQYLNRTDGGIYINGYYYRIFDYNNGYRGCIDTLSPLFDRNLFIGSTGYDVYCLQRKLGVDPVGYFGKKTRTAVANFQTVNGISPAFGYVGSKTRAVLNQ